MADIKNLTVLPRPRSAWQAMDAGFTLARAHYVKLVILWLGFSMPLFVVCALLQYWLGWSAILILWWWFKPLYELPLVFYLSRALFSENLSLRAAWKMTLANLGTLFKTYLTLARFSTARALTYSVVFLEQLPRKKRSGRIQMLTTETTRHYLLMIVCLHIEYILAYAIIAIVALTFFSGAIAEFDWSNYLTLSQSPELRPWMLALSFTTLIGGALVAPFYVGGGFLIYINRRMQLEAWDIEHRFRRIQPRTTASLASALLLIFGLGLFGIDTTQAAERAHNLDTREAVNTQLEQILTDAEFGSTKTQKVPKFDFDFERDDEESDSDLFDWFSGSTTTFALIVKSLLWIAIAVFIGLLLYTLLQFKRPDIKASPLTRTGRDADDAQSHPLTQNLPRDIVAAAEHLLQQGERRQALSVLFRGALRAVMNEYDLKVTRGATEADCKTSVASVASERQTSTFVNLLGVWQKEAYANQPQQEQQIATLIEEWKVAFDRNTHAHSAEPAA